MGKASSAKKIARAARAGAASGPKERRALGFPAVVVAIIVLGLVLVGFARATRDAQASPTLQDHWHSAYSLYDCAAGGYLPIFESQFDPQGIHSHQDSLIHIHPFSAEVTGRGATMDVFLDAMGASVESDAITLPGGEVLEAGVECDGEPTRIVVGRWNNGLDASGDPDELFTQDFGDINFAVSNEGYTIARVGVNENPPPPTEEAQESLAAVQGLSRDEGVEPPNVSARPGPQDFGTGTGDADTDAESTEGGAQDDEAPADEEGDGEG